MKTKRRALGLNRYTRIRQSSEKTENGAADEVHGEGPAGKRAPQFESLH